MKKNNSGFSIVELLAVILVISAVGTLGWVITKKDEDTAKNSNAEKSETVTADNEETTNTQTTTQEWALNFVSENKKFSASLPDGWVLSSNKGYDSVYAWTKDQIQYKQGTPAILEVLENGGRDGGSVAFSMSYLSDPSNRYIPPQSEIVKSYTTKSGITVEKRAWTQTKQPENIDLPYGATEYVYYINQGDKYVSVIHDVLSDETEQTSLIEQLIETVKFL